MLASGLFQLPKAKKHWLAVYQGEDETVFRLSTKNCSRIIEAAEAKTGKEVKVILKHGG